MGQLFRDYHAVVNHDRLSKFFPRIANKGIDRVKRSIYVDWLRILLPAIACIVILGSLKPNLIWHPALFAFLIGVGNWSTSFKFYNLFIILMGLLFSYISFFAGYFSFFILGIGLEAIGFNLKQSPFLEIITITPVYIIAPLILLYLYRIIYRISVNTRTVVSFILGTAILVGMFVKMELHTPEGENVLNYRWVDVFWPAIYSLVLQYSIYSRSWSK